jgi:hypothetical protein
MNNNLLQRVYMYVGALMSILIFVMGIGLLTTKALYETIPPPNRTYIGIIFIIYSIFRGIRVYQQIKRLKQNENN